MPHLDQGDFRRDTGRYAAVGLYIWSLFGPAFTGQYFGHEVMSQAQGRLSTMPFWYFPATFLHSYWPWMLAVAWAVRGRWWRPGQPQRQPLRDVVLLGSVWVGCVLLMLSLYPDKKPNKNHRGL